MSTRIGVALMAVAFLLYAVLIGQRAVIMLTTGEPLGIAFGIALIAFPIIGVWGIVRELLFGRDAERLGAQLEKEGALPDEEVTVTPSGRVKRADADALFPAYRAAVEEAPNDWRAWYRLGIVYDASGDRKRARSAIREAIKFSKSR